ncbi:MAG: heme NO-binding domain-containing protein [Nitrospirota bacterium]|nr:heme NO-binding domain-containing protein [Nitrospirota bacterium]
MKGIVFTEFLEMTEDRFGADTVERIIEESALPSGAAYTTVGTYDHRELLRLVGQVSAATGLPVPTLVRTFGQHLFGRFTQAYPKFFNGVGSAFDFLGKIESYIHVEVRKLYPDAELPHFEYQYPGPGRMDMTYRSRCPFSDLAEGLILGCIEYFGQPIELARTNLDEGGGTAVRFSLTQRLPQR